MKALFAAMLVGSFAVSPAAVFAKALPATAFSYDAAAPLNVQVHTQRTAAGVKISDITFASARGRKIHGELVAPAKSAAHRGAVLFVHWLGDPATTNLTEFRSDAMSLAKGGLVTLSIDAMWSQPEWFEKVRTLDTDYAKSIDQVVDIRRAIDVLLAQPGVDAARLAFVGHDFGAMYGAVVSGIDPRPQYYVLMAGTATFSEWYLLGNHPADTTAYVNTMAVLDPPNYLEQSQAKAFLFQFASRDRYIKPDRAYAFFDAAPVPKTMMVYAANHSLDVPAAHADRLAWLTARLAGSRP
jgi:cephalosporin-C deacetylase-like acetyl esterase